MTQEELLAQLRDIHLPAETAAGSVPGGFALWPIIVFAFALGSIFVIRYWHRTLWRRQARAALNTIELEPDLQQRWSSLLTLAAQIARNSGRPEIVPTSAYKHPQTVTDEDATVLGVHLRQEIAR